MSERKRERQREEKDEREAEEMIMHFKILLALKRKERELGGDKERSATQTNLPPLSLYPPSCVSFHSATSPCSSSVMELFLSPTLRLAACKNVKLCFTLKV